MSSPTQKDPWAAANLEDAERKLGEMFGLDENVSPEVCRRALDDPKFAMYLMLTRESPTLRDKLLKSPAIRASSAPAAPVTTEPSAKGAVELSVKALTAVAKWAGTGFKTADERTIARRWAACLACDYLTAPPNGIIYRGLKLLAGPENKICSACGCLARKKVTMPSEVCPKEDSASPDFTRWGEPRNVVRDQ